MERVRSRLTDFGVISAIWLSIAFITGSERWVSFDTPDAEFHASMAIFGSEVTDRAATPVYYWTRLGYIAPGRLLTNYFGPVTGLEILRLILLFLIIAGTWYAIRRCTDVWTSTVLTFLVASNTVVLGYLGNPYPSATVMAGMALLVAIGMAPRGPWGNVGAGVIVGWMVMTNPYGAILAVVAYLAVIIARGGTSVSRIARAGIWGLLGIAIGFGFLWIVGRFLFPGFDWVQTYLFWNSAIDQSDYIYDVNRWQYDPSLLVPAMAVVIGLVYLMRNPRDVHVRVGAVLGIAVTTFALVFFFAFPTNYLEIPHYQALLWIPALLSVSVIAASRVAMSRWSWARGGIGLVVVAVTVGAGYLDPSLSIWGSRMIAVAGVIVFLIAGQRWVPVLLATGLLMVAAQLLQNSRDTFGVSTDALYVNSYRSNEAREMIGSAVIAQEWVLSRTQPGDRVLTWVDAEWQKQEQDLLPMAAFQLWGANSAGQGPEVTTDMLLRWDKSKPLALALYGKSTESILQFWNSIPAERRPTVPECTQVPWPDYPSVQVCVTRLTW